MSETALAAVNSASPAQARPTPAHIDEIAERYLTAKVAVTRVQAIFSAIEQEAVELVTNYGIVPAHAEKSRRLVGKLAELTVTKSDTLTINDERVEMLRDALAANRREELFPRLFTLRSKYEVVEGADQLIRTESLSKRLSEKILSLWGRCISVRPKKPSLRVTILDPSAPAKKSRRKKGGE